MTSYCKLEEAMKSYPEACPNMNIEGTNPVVEHNYAGSTCLADIISTGGCRDMSQICDFDANCISCYEPDTICFACQRGYYLVQGYCIQLNTDEVIPTKNYVFFTRNFESYTDAAWTNSASWFAGNSHAFYDPASTAQWGNFD